MSDNIQYEPVPESDLKDHQVFHANKAKHTDIEPWQGGTTAEILGIPTIGGAKTASGILKSNITKELTNRIAEKLQPKSQANYSSLEGLDPTEKYARKMFSGEYPGGTDMKEVWEARRTAQSAAQKQAQLDQLNMLFRSAPGGEGVTPSVPPTGQPVGGTMPAAMGEAALPSTPTAPAAPPLTMGQKAFGLVKSMAGSPIAKAVGTGAGLWEGGENAVRLWNHFKQGNVGREFLDTAGLISNAAMMTPTPLSPESNIAGAALSLPIGYYQKKLDEEDAAQNKAIGGLINLR